MIELKHVSKSFPTKSGTVVALNDINLCIKDGDIYGIIGLSGAGKSTLVRCINLLEKPSAGEIYIDGENILEFDAKRLAALRRNIGMIFQSFNLLEQRTVAANIAFPLEIAKYSKEEREKRVKELLKLVGLVDKEKAYPSQLSGGQKQRVAIARALATRPKYLLCDEATSSLDPNTTSSILDLLKSINQELGVTIIVITHEMRVIESICNKVAVIDHSQIVESGLVSQVFADPKSQIARELILPDLLKLPAKDTTQVRFRLIFKGEVINQPIISDLAIKCQVPINILYADAKSIENKTYGQMVITIPNEEEIVSKITAYLDQVKVTYVKEV